MKRIVLLVVATIVALFAVVNAAPAKIDSVVNKEIKIIKTDDDKSQKDSILFSKLSAEQLMELEREEAKLEMERIDVMGRNDMPLNGLGIVVIAIMPFVFVLLLLWIIGRERSKESIRKHDLYLKSLELGQTLPENFFEKPAQQMTSSNLKKGILWLAVGLALLIYFIIIHKNFALIAGIIPTFVGLGYLLVHFLDKPKNNNEQNG
jgi:Ca2+/Na+ antiporter